MKLSKDDVLNVIVTDLVANQVIQALQLGYTHNDIQMAVARGLSHGIYEFEKFRAPPQLERAHVTV